METRLCQFNSTDWKCLFSPGWGRLLLLLLGSFVCMEAVGQTIAWDKTLGGNNNDALTALRQTHDGGYMLGGSSYSASSGNKTGSNQGLCDVSFCSNDYWVVKLDAAGNKAWDKTLGGSTADFLTALQPTLDGGYILGGYSSSGSSGDKTQHSRGSYDFWVVKLDAAGNKTWDKTYGGKGAEILTSLQQTPDGGYVLGGSSPSGGGDKTGPGRGKWDYWVVKLDADGNKQWDKTLGGSDNDRLAALHLTPDGGYLLGGYSSSDSSGDKTLPSRRESFDFWVVKLDAAGHQQWDKTYGGDKNDMMTALQPTQDGGYVLGGYVQTGSDGDITGTNKGGWDYWVLKLDAAGDKQWDQSFGGRDQDLLTCLQQTQDGGYLLGGHSDSDSNGDKSGDNRGGSDYWVLKLDAAGNKVWDKTFGGQNTDRMTTLLQASDGSYLLAGSSDSGISGEKSQASLGGTDYWVIKDVVDADVSPPALIWSFEPERGLHGTLVSITGLHLATTAAVRFNEMDAAFVVVSDSLIQATVPVNATSGDITLVTAGGSVISSSPFSLRHPLIRTYTPIQGPAGTLVAMAGKRLTTVKEVYFGEVLATQFEVLSDSAMTAVVPEGATIAKIRVVLTGGGKGSSSTKFLVTSPELAVAKLARKENPPAAKPAAPSLAAYPNPFRQQVTFRFSLPLPQPVVVKVYDLLGREVSLLYQGEVQAQQPYQVEWHPGPQQAGGLYFLRVQAPGQVSQHKVMLVR